MTEVAFQGRHQKQNATEADSLALLSIVEIGSGAISTLVDFHLFADWLARTAFYAAPSPDSPDSGKAILLHFSPSCGCIRAPLT
ncbi:hypothetical protein KC340_g100 [Hortaea werneckii]|nr:hypothetical protein KC340_g100 [Hortaea werneckii]